MNTNTDTKTYIEVLRDRDQIKEEIRKEIDRLMTQAKPSGYQAERAYKGYRGNRSYNEAMNITFFPNGTCMVSISDERDETEAMTYYFGVYTDNQGAITAEITAYRSSFGGMNVKTDYELALSTKTIVFRTEPLNKLILETDIMRDGPNLELTLK